MISDFLAVLLKLSAMFLVMAAGWAVRRGGLLTDEAGRVLSRLLVDLIFPALVFTQMLRTATPGVLRASWYVPLLGAGVIVLAKFVGWAGMPLFSRRGDRRTAVFLVALPNWVYFPLPIAAQLFGESGVRDVLLCNVGAQVMLWTVGVWTLRGVSLRGAALKGLATNYGLIATAAGIGLALAWPAARDLELLAGSEAAPARLAPAAIIQALAMLGSLTIPLSLMITGVQLGGLALSDHYPSRDFVGVLVLRLLAAPALTIGLVVTAARFGLRVPDETRLITYLIAAMPVGISCSIVTERYGGDTSLAARAIFYSTLWSIGTVPVLYALVRAFGL